MKNSRMPSLIYGTAWKKARTAEVTKMALDCGFRAIDTANQLKHYDEAGVGEALRAFWAEGHPRETVFLQTKFTSQGGQDHRLPYDPRADLKTQVRQSFESSLGHLGVEYLDSYLVHGPQGHPGLIESDWEVWEEMEKIHSEGAARLIGISNVNAFQLGELVTHAKIKPHFVQNRCYAARGWDRDIRRVCENHQIRYQGFSLLTGNPHEMASPPVAEAASRLKLTPAQVIFCFAKHLGMIPLTGTTSRAHGEEDLRSLDASLLPEELSAIEKIGG